MNHKRYYPSYETGKRSRIFHIFQGAKEQ